MPESQRPSRPRTSVCQTRGVFRLTSSLSIHISQGTTRAGKRSLVDSGIRSSHEIPKLVMVFQNLTLLFSLDNPAFFAVERSLMRCAVCSFTKKLVVLLFHLPLMFVVFCFSFSSATNCTSALSYVAWVASCKLDFVLDPKIDSCRIRTWKMAPLMHKITCMIKWCKKVLQ